MSALDQRIVEAIGLSHARLAPFLGVSRQALSKGIQRKRDYFDPSTLILLEQKFRESGLGFKADLLREFMLPNPQGSDKSSLLVKRKRPLVANRLRENVQFDHRSQQYVWLVPHPEGRIYDELQALLDILDQHPEKRVIALTSTGSGAALFQPIEQGLAVTEANDDSWPSRRPATLIVAETEIQPLTLELLWALERDEIKVFTQKGFYPVDIQLAEYARRELLAKAGHLLNQSYSAASIEFCARPVWTVAARPYLENILRLRSEWGNGIGTSHAAMISVLDEIAAHVRDARNFRSDYANWPPLLSRDMASKISSRECCWRELTSVASAIASSRFLPEKQCRDWDTFVERLIVKYS